MKRNFILFFSIALFAVLPVFSADMIANDDIQVLTENRDVASFDRIHISGRFNIVVYQSSTCQVSVAAPEKLLASVGTTVSNAVLSIQMLGESDAGLIDNLKSKYNDYLLRQPIEVKVGIPNLNSLEASGASRIVSDGTLILTSLRVSLSGTTKAELECAVDKSLAISLTEAVRLEIKGESPELSITANGASVFDGNSLKSKQVNVNLKGASRAEVVASESIDATLVGATKLVCSGSPQSVKQNASRGSSVIIR